MLRREGLKRTVCLELSLSGAFATAESLGTKRDSVMVSGLGQGLGRNDEINGTVRGLWA